MALLIGLPVLYVASFGAACGFVERRLANDCAGRVRVPAMSRSGDRWPYGCSNAPHIVRGMLWGAYALADAIARKEFDLAPYRGVTGGLFP